MLGAGNSGRSPTCCVVQAYKVFFDTFYLVIRIVLEEYAADIETIKERVSINDEY